MKVIAREWPVMAASAFIMLLLVVMTASLGYLFEHEAQPEKFENIPQSIYWAVITLASVGYGDISPVTPAGRAMTIVLALIGIGIFAIPAALLSSSKCWQTATLTKKRLCTSKQKPSACT
jgi:voltage-gated potassium channel Kch